MSDISDEDEEAHFEPIGVDAPSEFVYLDDAQTAAAAAAAAEVAEATEDSAKEKMLPRPPPVIHAETASQVDLEAALASTAASATRGDQGAQAATVTRDGTVVHDLHRDKEQDRHRIATALLQSTPMGEWTTGICRCWQQICPSCCMAMCCPCVLAGQISEALEVARCPVVVGVGLFLVVLAAGALALGGLLLFAAGSLCIICPYSAVWTCVLRRKMRSLFAIDEACPCCPCCDLVCAGCCCMCTLSQMARHLYGYTSCCEPITCNRQGISPKVAMRLQMAAGTKTFGPQNAVTHNEPHQGVRMSGGGRAVGAAAGVQLLEVHGNSGATGAATGGSPATQAAPPTESTTGRQPLLLMRTNPVTTQPVGAAGN